MKRHWLAGLAMMVPSLVLAAGEPAAVTDTLARILPGSEPDRVTKTPLPGLYEVVYGTEVVYVSADGQYLIQGDLIDLKAGRNLTEDQRAEGRQAALAELDPATAVTFKPDGPVKHTVTVFTDIDCPYCRRMHQQIDRYTQRGIAVRYLAYPRTGKDTPSYGKAVSVWCADDQRQAMTDAKAGQSVPKRQCDNPVDEHMALAQQIGITGTPTLVMDDGQVLPGYVPAQQLAQMLDGEQQARMRRPAQ